MNRRSLLKTGMFAGSAAAMAGAGLLATTPSSGIAQESGPNEPLTRGDIAILRFLAVAELIESDLWNQYAELGGVTDGTQNNYQLALQYLDGDGSQYITSNTLDENTHADFLNKYLEMKGAEPVDLTPFKRLPGSTASGSSGALRLTNLMNLNVDTSWYIRYRSSTNPDFGATFPQAITIHNRTAIPRNDNDFDGEDHIQAINLIFPVPCEFISPNLPKVSVLRPLTDKFGGAQATVAFLEGENLFQGQGKDFLHFLQGLAAEADAVQRNR